MSRSICVKSIQEFSKVISVFIRFTIIKPRLYVLAIISCKISVTLVF